MEVLAVASLIDRTNGARRGLPFPNFALAAGAGGRVCGRCGAGPLGRGAGCEAGQPARTRGVAGAAQVPRAATGRRLASLFPPTGWPQGRPFRLETNQHSILLSLQPGRHDGDGQRVAADAARHLGLTYRAGPQRRALRRALTPASRAAQVAAFGRRLPARPRAAHAGRERASPLQRRLPAATFVVAKGPGVTDDEGTSAQNALSDFLNEPIDVRTQHIFSEAPVLAGGGAD